MISITPQFNFDNDTMALDDAEAEKAMEDKGFQFEEGRRELKILNAYFNGPASGDPTWHKIVLELGTGEDNDNRSIRAYPMVPTTGNIMYQKAGGKPTIFVWKKLFVPLFTALGETPKPSTLSTIVNKYLSKTKNIEIKAYEDGVEVENTVPQLTSLIGKTVDITIGYEGYYIKEQDNGEFAIFRNGKVVEKEGVKLIGETYTDCQSLAIEHELIISRLNVTTFHPKKVSPVNDFSNL